MGRKARALVPLNHSEKYSLLDRLFKDQSKDCARCSWKCVSQSLRKFLLWKFEPDPNGKKPRKVPYYTSGKRRSGTQGSPDDRAQLATFKEALKASFQSCYLMILLLDILGRTLLSD